MVAIQIGARRYRKRKSYAKAVETRSAIKRLNKKQKRHMQRKDQKIDRKFGIYFYNLRSWIKI